MLMTNPEEKPLVWLGSSKKAFDGERHDAAKVLKGFGGAGVLEIVDNDRGGTYRVIYTVKFREAVCVLHVFHKKSKSGIAIPKPDMDIIRERLKIAEKLSQEMRDE